MRTPWWELVVVVVVMLDKSQSMDEEGLMIWDYGLQVVIYLIDFDTGIVRR